MSERSIFITGAASGIGREAARLFNAKGWRVGLCDRYASALAVLSAELGPRSSEHVVDVTDSEALRGAIEIFCGRDGLDILFNCAGILEMRSFAKTPRERLVEVINVNVVGVINSIHHALPSLRRAADARIITMSSVAAIYGIPEEATYSASKFAVRALTEALNIELADEDIWVCDVMVAYVGTPMIHGAAHVAKSVDILGINVTPEQVAQTVFEATGERRVHWFVTDADAAVAAQVDATPWEERPTLMRAISGFQDPRAA
tara:strand:+ start:2187 stop:2969 length:783 start_codon:yes stop_codon:yes gene_type:complete